MAEEGQRGTGVSGGQTHLARLQQNRNHVNQHQARMEEGNEYKMG
jgi:hypothetical protein